MNTKNCPSCGAPIAPDESECKYCGEKFAIERPAQPQYAPPQQPPYAPPQYAPPQYAPPQYGQPQYGQPQYPTGTYNSNKSKTTAGLLAIFLGGIGVHKFYLGKPGLGILYLVFCWTYIPAIIGFIEGIIYLASSDETFHTKYAR
ncbi:MAG: TM2 domain-containing protein [Bacteroidota bacterium]|nr:TM2 domain-containing protein [Bacteroidota bacterium]